MPHRLDRVVRAALSEPWAIHEPKFALVVEVLSRRLSGERLDAESIAAAIAADAETRHEARRGEVTRSGVGGAIAVLPVHGILAHRMNMVNNASGPMGTSIEWLQQAIRSADQDPQVSAILLELDSPGGSVSLIDEMAREIRSARTRVVAHVNDFAASAAFWIASAADEIVSTPSGMVGSIGVVAVHTDLSKAEEQEGITTTFITAGKGKADGNSSQPLSDDARADIQRTVDAFYASFVAGVVEGRNAAFAQADGRTSRGRRRISEDTVRDEWQAKVFTSAEALERGMIDQIATIEETIQSLAADVSSSRAAARASAEDAARIRARRKLTV